MVYVCFCFADAPFPTITSPVIYVAPGQDVTIECFFSAKPDVDVVNWHHNNSYLKLNMDHETNMKDSKAEFALLPIFCDCSNYAKQPLST